MPPPINGLSVSSMYLMTRKLEINWGRMPLPQTQSWNLLKCHPLRWLNDNFPLPPGDMWFGLQTPGNAVLFIIHRSISLFVSPLLGLGRLLVTTGLGSVPHLCVLTHPFTSWSSSYHIVVQVPQYLTSPSWPCGHLSSPLLDQMISKILSTFKILGSQPLVIGHNQGQMSSTDCFYPDRINIF